MVENLTVSSRFLFHAFQRRELVSITWNFSVSSQLFSSCVVGGWGGLAFGGGARGCKHIKLDMVRVNNSPLKNTDVCKTG